MILGKSFVIFTHFPQKPTFFVREFSKSSNTWIYFIILYFIIFPYTLIDGSFSIPSPSEPHWIRTSPLCYRGLRAAAASSRQPRKQKIGKELLPLISSIGKQLVWEPPPPAQPPAKPDPSLQRRGQGEPNGYAMRFLLVKCGGSMAHESS